MAQVRGAQLDERRRSGLRALTADGDARVRTVVPSPKPRPWKRLDQAIPDPEASGQALGALPKIFRTLAPPTAPTQARLSPAWS